MIEDGLQIEFIHSYCSSYATSQNIYIYLLFIVFYLFWKAALQDADHSYRQQLPHWVVFTYTATIHLSFSSESAGAGQRMQRIEALFKCCRFVNALSQIVIDRRYHLDGTIDLRVAPRRIGADIDKIF